MTDAGGPRILVDGVRIRHEGRERFSPDGVTLSVAPGESVLLMGPSGSGKSTLALALNGLVPHAVAADLDGRIVVDGVDTATTTVARLSERVGMVFQDADAQVVTATVLDEVCFGPENQLLPVEEVLQRAERALRLVGLWERRDDNPDILSGGGRQRLAIAAALALDPDTLVLDEPTANLDAAGADDVYDALSSLAADGRHSIVLIEHDLDRAVRIVDRVVVIDALGRPVGIGTPRGMLADRADEMHELGVWLPPATEAARALRRAGVAIERMPLTGEELTAALDALPSLPPLPVPPATTARPVTAAPETAGALPAVSLEHVTLRRRRAVILDDVSLRVDPGSFWAVLGVNGAGKSSLVHTMVGIAAPTTGRVRIGALDPARVSASRLTHHVGFVFQNPEHQFVEHTVFDELAYGPRAARLDGDEVDRRVTGMLERFGLADLASVHPFLLSGGQKRRLSVATALISGATTLVLDEPTFGQDRERRDDLLALLSDLNAQGTTVIVVTHDLQLAADHADHVAVMAQGRVVATGPTAEILRDAALLRRHGLRQPPLARAFGALEAHPEWRGVTRLAQLPGADR